MADRQFRPGYRVTGDKTGADAVHKPAQLKRHRS